MQTLTRHTAIKLAGLALSAAICCSFIPAALAVDTIPGIPHQFYGTVTLSSGSSQEGLPIVAKADNNLILVIGTVQGGKYGYNSVFKAEDKNNNLAGKTIKFFVGNVLANETAVFKNGEATNLNLTVPWPTQQNNQPASSGGGGGAPEPPTQTVQQTVRQRTDVNGDNKINILDFNALMINWGKTVTNNVADFNNDGKVDIIDFNALMIYWTK